MDLAIFMGPMVLTLAVHLAVIRDCSGCSEPHALSSGGQVSQFMDPSRLCNGVGVYRYTLYTSVYIYITHTHTPRHTYTYTHICICTLTRLRVCGMLSSTSSTLKNCRLAARSHWMLLGN